MQAHAQYQSVLAGDAAPAKPAFAAQAFGVRGAHGSNGGALLAAEAGPSKAEARQAATPPSMLSGKRLVELEAAIAALSAQSNARAAALEAAKSEAAQHLARVRLLEARLVDAEKISLDRALQLTAKEAEVWRLLRAMADHVTEEAANDDEDEEEEGEGAEAKRLTFESDRSSGEEEEGGGLKALLDAMSREKADAEARAQALEEEVYALKVTVAKLSACQPAHAAEAAAHAQLVAALAREVSASRERALDGSAHATPGRAEVNEGWFDGAFA
jgi:hypothetical protein